MKRWAWNLFCLFSLLVFATSVTIWVRSYFVSDWFSWVREPLPGRVIDNLVVCSQGYLMVSRGHYEYKYRSPWPVGVWHRAFPPTPITRTASGKDIHFNFHIGRAQYLSGESKGDDWHTRYKWVILPLWLFLPAGVPPFLWWRKWRKKGTRGFPVVATAG